MSQAVKKIAPNDYLQSLKDLLSNYEEGWNVFKNAEHWDCHLRKKPGAEKDPSLPGTWMELAERAIGIIAVEKYGLDVYENTIEIITASQMLDNYASGGMPISYEHWSFGKQRILEDKAYKQGHMGLAYEIVINTNPAIAYCMETNTPLMQILVIAHASFGHNSFFKGNGMFRQFTDATNILGDMKRLRDFIHECEEKVGYEEVEKLLDACHALKMQDVDRYTKPDPGPSDSQIENARQRREDRFRNPPPSDLFGSIKKDFDDASAPDNGIGEENILRYIADNAPHLPEWKRRIMHMISDQSQYFYPQMQTQVMNEGWASFWHYTLLNDMADIGLLNDKMMAEFQDSHAGVLFQPGIDSPYFQGGRMNPYALGFAIFQDIKRMCLNPTEEDREWFPDIAGKSDWLSVMKDAMENFKDESFILQYLSPRVIRDFGLFNLHDDPDEDEMEVTAIQDSKGYRDVRESLAATYRLGDNLPYLEVHSYNERTDRSLVIHHLIQKGKPLDEDSAEEVLRHLYQLWGHPVIIKSMDETGKMVDQLKCPWNTSAGTQLPLHRP